MTKQEIDVWIEDNGNCQALASYCYLFGVDIENLKMEELSAKFEGQYGSIRDFAQEKEEEMYSDILAGIGYIQDIEARDRTRKVFEQLAWYVDTENMEDDFFSICGDNHASEYTYHYDEDTECYFIFKR